MILADGRQLEEGERLLAMSAEFASCMMHELDNYRWPHGDQEDCRSCRTLEWARLPGVA